MMMAAERITYWPGALSPPPGPTVRKSRIVERGCQCADCRAGDALPADQQGWPGCYQLALFGQLRSFPYVWFWKAKLGERKGQRCRVTARGRMNSIEVEFQDGFRVITARHAVRKPKEQPHG